MGLETIDPIQIRALLNPKGEQVNVPEVASALRIPYYNNVDTLEWDPINYPNFNYSGPLSSTTICTSDGRIERVRTWPEGFLEAERELFKFLPTSDNRGYDISASNMIIPRFEKLEARTRVGAAGLLEGAILIPNCETITWKGYKGAQHTLTIASGGKETQLFFTTRPITQIAGGVSTLNTRTGAVSVRSQFIQSQSRTVDIPIYAGDTMEGVPYPATVICWRAVNFNKLREVRKALERAL
jgi:hypothetical protein